MKHFDIFRPINDNNANNLAIAYKVCNYISTEDKIVFQCEAIPLHPDTWHEKLKSAWWTDKEIIIVGNVSDLMSRDPHFPAKHREGK